MKKREYMYMKTAETFNVSIVTLSESHKKEVEDLYACIKELTTQVAWLNCLLFCRKPEKPPSLTSTIQISLPACCQRMRSRYPMPMSRQWKGLRRPKRNAI